MLATLEAVLTTAAPQEPAKDRDNLVEVSS